MNMYTSRFKYLLAVSLLMIYINRGFFVSPYEMNTDPYEINSLAELMVQLITGQSNGIDEDGDLQETHNFAKTLQPDITNHFSQMPEWWAKFSVQLEKHFLQKNESIPQLLYYGQIDHPPEQ